MGLFVECEIARLCHAFTCARVSLAFLLGQFRHHLVHGDVHLGVIFSLATDDERRARFINQN